MSEWLKLKCKCIKMSKLQVPAEECIPVKVDKMSRLRLLIKKNIGSPAMLTLGAKTKQDILIPIEQYHLKHLKVGWIQNVVVMDESEVTLIGNNYYLNSRLREMYKKGKIVGVQGQRLKEIIEKIGG